MKRKKTAIELQLEIMQKIAAIIGEDTKEFEDAVKRYDFEKLAYLRGKDDMRGRIYNMVYEISDTVEE